MNNDNHNKSLTESFLNLEKSHILLKNDIGHIIKNQDSLVSSQKNLSESVEKLVLSVNTLVTTQAQTQKSFDIVHKRIDEEVEKGIDRHEVTREMVDLKLKPLVGDVKQLKADKTWITRVIIGKILIIAITAIFYFNGTK